jgi:hypothetical protein
MKIESNKFYFLAFSLFGIMNIFAADPPTPSPFGRRRLPPPPPGLPIDENIFILMIIAILFGIYIIYSFKLKTKTPI